MKPTVPVQLTAGAVSVPVDTGLFMHTRGSHAHNRTRLRFFSFSSLQYKKMVLVLTHERNLGTVTHHNDTIGNTVIENMELIYFKVPRM